MYEEEAHKSSHKCQHLKRGGQERGGGKRGGGRGAWEGEATWRQRRVEDKKRLRKEGRIVQVKVFCTRIVQVKVFCTRLSE